jgi:putative ABC transport system ATP-binding protein
MANFIQFKNVNYQIKHPARHILSNINLNIAKNDFIIILGNNGSGKSSLLKLLDKRYQASSGNIEINTHSIKTYDTKAFSKLLITLTQNPLASLFPSLTIYENCQIALQHSGQKLSPLKQKNYFKTYLADYNSNLPKQMSNLVGSLSGGELQALALALACLARPQILLLDEHTSALDPNAADRLMQITQTMIQRYGITCFLTTHNLEIAKNYGTRLIAIQQGAIAQDYNFAEKQLLTQEDLKKFCYEH